MTTQRHSPLLFSDRETKGASEAGPPPLSLAWFPHVSFAAILTDLLLQSLSSGNFRQLRQWPAAKFHLRDFVPVRRILPEREVREPGPHRRTTWRAVPTAQETP